MSEHRAHDYYRKLVGKTFNGEFKGIWSRGDSESKKFAKIDISAAALEGLAEIQANFEGLIWKGFHGGILYVDPNNLSGCELNEIYYFQIIDYSSFQFPEKDFKERKKYKDHCGFYFVLGRSDCR